MFKILLVVPDASFINVCCSGCMKVSNVMGTKFWSTEDQAKVGCNVILCSTDLEQSIWMFNFELC